MTGARRSAMANTMVSPVQTRQTPAVQLAYLRTALLAATVAVTSYQRVAATRSMFTTSRVTYISYM